MTSLSTGISTLTRGLYVQQLTQNTIARNLSTTYRDSDGYVSSSRNRVETSTLSSLKVYTGSGYVSVGQGSQVSAITRLRSFYLDYQIQKQSMTVGKEETLAEALDEVATILDNTAGTLDGQLTTLAADFAALSSDPTNVTLRDAVVSDGVTFAEMAQDEYASLTTLQSTLNTDVKSVVSNINAILQDLNSVNKQLLANASSSSSSNDLLDERDYDLDKLGRLINFTASYGTNGTVSVSLNGLSLVNSAGAAVLSANLINEHNPSLSDISYQSSEGTEFDITNQITGGQLAGLLEARDVTVENYKNELDDYVTSVMTMVNMIHRSGYGLDGVTTGTNFFTGTSARDILVNASIQDDSDLVAASSRYGETTNGQIAEFLGDLPDLVTNNYIASYRSIDTTYPADTYVDPSVALNSTTTTTLNVVGSNKTDLATTATSGSFTVNGLTITYTTGESIYDILDSINNADSTVHAMFSYTDQKIYIVSTGTIKIANATGNFMGFTSTRSMLTSMIRMNNDGSTTGLKISSTTALNTSLNTQAFKVTPSTKGSFQINGVTVTWTNGMSLMGATNSIQAAILAATGGTVSMLWNANTEQVTLYSTSPITITDLTGNFTTFTGLNGSSTITSMGSELVTDASDAAASADSVRDSAQTLLTQLNNEQASVAAVSYSTTDDETAYESEITAAIQSMLAYNAALQVEAILDKMIENLIAIVNDDGNGVLRSSALTSRY